jgi:hypothetical protein
MNTEIHEPVAKEIRAWGYNCRVDVVDGQLWYVISDEKWECPFWWGTMAGFPSAALLLEKFKDNRRHKVGKPIEPTSTPNSMLKGEDETAPLLQRIAELEAQNRELLRERHALGIQIETLQMDDSIANDAIEALAAENERYKAALQEALAKKGGGDVD